MDIEHATVQTADGAQVRRPEAERSVEKFKRALAARGGSMPPRMHWNERRGFYSPAGLTVAQARERNRVVAREIAWEQLRLKLGPRLAVMAAKLDESMR